MGGDQVLSLGENLRTCDCSVIFIGLGRANALLRILFRDVLIKFVDLGC